MASSRLEGFLDTDHFYYLTTITVKIKENNTKVEIDEPLSL